MRCFYPGFNWLGFAQHAEQIAADQAGPDMRERFCNHLMRDMLPNDCPPGVRSDIYTKVEAACHHLYQSGLPKQVAEFLTKLKPEPT